jgi:U2 small nuclear ribonucleoprotein B''
LFEAYGQITQIICKKNNKMRGQAFVVFKEVNEAVMARNSLNNYPIFGKPMKIEFSRKRSKVAAYIQE